ncbi:MAG TPA: response regulator [Acidobacteriota bacterium]|nr:response regulator [Acidobacteriota bacterium]
MKSRARILVVDDEELLRNMLRSILLREGYRSVRCVPDGMTALHKLKKQKFDIMLTDVRMPDMSGIELLIKAKRLYPGMGVVVMTGFGDVHTPEEARGCGADEYITKPFKVREVEVIVERVRVRQMVGGLGRGAEVQLSA